MQSSKRDDPKRLKKQLDKIEQRPKPLTAKEKAQAVRISTNIDDGPNEKWNSYMRRAK